MPKNGVSKNAYSLIKDKITSGEYHSSQRLVEEQVAKELSLSRHTVRSALQKLEADGLVRIEANRGASVASMTLEQALDTLFARKILEMEITRAAAERITEKEISLLENYLNNMLSFLEQEKFDDYSQTNRLFHKVIYEASGKETLAWLISLLRERMARMNMRTILIPGRSWQSASEHKAIFKALANGRPDEAAEAAGLHMLNLARIVESSWGLIRS